MDKIVRRYVFPIGILLVGSFIITFLANNFSNVVSGNVYYFLIAAMLFAFGLSLNNQKSRFKSFYWRHIIIILILVLMFLYDLNVIEIKAFDFFRKYIVADNTVIKVFYVYLGWLFAEK